MKIKLRTGFILAIDAIIIIIAVLNLIALKEKATIPGLGKTDNFIFIEDFKYFKSGDRIVRINNEPVSSLKQVEFICDNHTIGDDIDVTVVRNKNSLNFEIKLMNYYNDFYIIIVIIVGMIFIFPGVYILIKNQGVTFAVVFHWLMISGASMIMLDWGAIGKNYFLEILTRSLYDVSMISTAFTLLNFGFLFPRQKISSRNKWIIALYCILIISSIFIFQKQYELINYKTMESFGSYYLWIHTYGLKGVLIPVFIFIAISFYFSYKQSNDEDAKRKYRWLFIGILFGPFIYIFFYMLPSPDWLNLPIKLPEGIMLISLAFAPITFSIAIIRYRLMDVNLIINRGMVYGAVIGFLLLIYVSIFLLGKNLVENFAIEKSNLKTVLINQENAINQISLMYLMISVVGVIIFSLLFQPMKNKVQLFIDKRFFKIRYNFKTTKENFSINIKDCINEQQVKDLVSNSILEIMPLNNCIILSRFDDFEETQKEVLKVENQIKKDLNILIRYSHPNRLYSKKGVLEEGIGFVENDEILKNLNAKLILISNSDDKNPVTAFILGGKKTMLMFTYEDIDILKYFGDEASNAIQKIRLQQNLILQEAETKRLLELSQIKSYFVSSVSHELKTPLTSIKMFSELLEIKPDLPVEKKKEYLSIIQGECDRLNRLINNVLDFSKIEKGKKEYKFKEFDLQENLQKVIKSLNYQMKLKQFNFEIDLADIDYTFNGDYDAISEVFINIISNAIKYSFWEKEIKINSYEKDDYICIEIADKGIGISKDDLQRIFEPYFRAKDTNVASSGGTGIGLSLVKEIIDAHNAKIEVESEFGEGSKFILYFPKVHT